MRPVTMVSDVGAGDPKDPPGEALAATVHGGPDSGPLGGDAPRAVKSHIGPYVIDRVVGAGGMGVVYVATDPKLDRKVAIKVLRRGGAVTDERLQHRLVREARAMAKLSHPNVVTIYSVDTDGGEIYFAMEFVEGRTLRDWLREPHSWRDVVKTLIGAGRGLEAAHAVGLIHRDFKPENVMIEPSGRARVSDFGIASEHEESSASRAGAAVDPRGLDLTGTGDLVGTPRYMSPEQFTGAAIDPRSDQFSFCLVLYEALYGRHAFIADTAEDLVARLTRGERAKPPAHAGVPTWLEDVIARGLATRVDDRFPSMTALLDELERGDRPPGGELALPEKPSIAVLPFDNLSGDPEQGHIADGIVETITAVLSRIRTFFVISRNSAFAYKGRARNVRDVGRELGVAYVLEGGLQRVGSRVRITVQLLETAGGAHLWAEKYDGTLDEIFDLQDRITEQVAGALQPSIRLAEIERARRKRPLDQGAYDYTMRAMQHVWTLEKDEAAIGLELLDKALAIDANYPLALALKAWVLAQHSVYNWAADPAGMVAEAVTLADRAANHSTDDPLILTVMGAVHTFARNFGVARVMLQRALALDPNSSWAMNRLGWVDVYVDRPDEAAVHFEKAMRLSPLDPMNFNNIVGLGAARLTAGDDNAAADLFLRALQERPNAHWIHRTLAPALYSAGRLEEAAESRAVLLRHYPDITIKKFKAAMVQSPSLLERLAVLQRALGIPEE